MICCFVSGVIDVAPKATVIPDYELVSVQEESADVVKLIAIQLY